MREYGPGHPLVFSHVPKTAGTSLRTALRKALRPEVHVDGLDASLFGGYDDVDGIDADLRAEIHLTPDSLPADATLVAAHISPGTTMARYPGADHITILRTPEVRLISQFLHCRGLTEFDIRRWGPAAEAFRAGWRPLGAFLADPMVAPNVDNTITRFLTWPQPLLDQTAFIDEADDDVLFEAAVDRLDSFGHVNVVENPAFMAELSAWLGRPLPDTRLNERMSVPARRRPDLDAELDPATRELLAHRCRIDHRVWAHVLAQVVPDADPASVRDAAMAKAIDRYSAMLREPDHTPLTRKVIHRLWDVKVKLTPGA
jgi:hypothetical protein